MASQTCLAYRWQSRTWRRAGMTAYLIRRVGTSIVILIGISIFVFILLHSVFPSPAIVILGPKATPKSVAALFGERWARSLYLSGMGILVAILIAIPLGIYQAVKRNTLGDQAITAVAFTTYAMPDFFLYLIAIQVFAISLPIFSFEAS